MLDLAQKRADITLEVIQELHRAVLGPQDPRGGEVRRERNSIYGSRHVTPDYVKVPRLLEEMIARYHEDQSRGVHPVNVASRLQFDLLTIHPFPDGNGRTARLVEKLHLIREGYAPILIDPQEKARYFDVLQQRRSKSQVSATQLHS